jgi:type I restriction enzyme M protein
MINLNDSRNNLIRAFADSNNILRSEGLRAGIERFSEFSNILFLKLLSENEQASYWNLMKTLPDNKLISTMNDLVIKEIENKYGGNVFVPVSIQNPSTLRKIINRIDPLALSTIDTDIKGDAFEYFLKQTTSTQNELGEYFTPRNVVKLIINMIEPKFKEKIYDPFCGTGGFLTEAFNYIKDNNSVEKKEDFKKLKEETFYGSEITITARIAKMNMILHGEAYAGIKQIDSLANPIDGQYDVVVTNIPFSQTTEHGSLYYNGIAKKHGDSVCVLHCLKALKKSGRMALIVPEGFLFRKDLARVREFLLSKSKLQIIVSLPKGTFSPHTGVKTDILYFTDAHKINTQKNYWYFDAKNIGVTLDSRKRKLDGMNDFNKINSFDIRQANKNADIKNNMLKVGFEIVDLKKVKSNNYNLVGNAYKANKSFSKYKVVFLDEICTSFEYGYTSKSTRNGDVRYIRITDIQKNGSLGEDKVFIKENKKNQKFILNKDDLIVARIGSVGKSYLYDSEEKAIFASYLIRLHIKKNILLPKYLKYYFDSDNYWDQVKELTTGSVQPQFNAPSLRKIKVPLPEIKEQKKIIDELDRYQKIIYWVQQIIDGWEQILRCEIVDKPEQERKMIEFQKDMISIFKEKMNNRLNDLWQLK